MTPTPAGHAVAAPITDRETLTRAIGPTVGYHISQCKHGGFIVCVNGAIHAARSTLIEAVQAMGRVAANQYSEAAEPPERAREVTPLPVEDDPSLDNNLPRYVRPPQMQSPRRRGLWTAARLRKTAQAALIALVVGWTAMVRGGPT
jgi:hypothetical protein